jgi:hypothetical protein
MRKEHDPKPQPLTFEEVTRVAKEVLLQHGNHVPTVIADGSKQAVVTQILEMADTHERRVRQMFETGFFLARSGEVGALKQAFFITEAWLSVAKVDEPPKVRPAQDPQRKEVLLISSLKLQLREQQSALVEMIRDSQGKLVKLQEMNFDQPDEGDNRLLSAFVAGFTAASTAKFN